MARPKPDKTTLLRALAAYVLEHGLNTASLRPMAAAAGTSDRMLIYHFGTKEALIAEILEFLAVQMADGLDAALPQAPFESEQALVRQVVALMRSEPFRPCSRVWLDIVSAAAQGQAAHVEAGGKIIDAFRDWLAARHPDGAARASALLTLIEGIIVMDAVGRGDVADAAMAALPARPE